MGVEITIELPDTVARHLGESNQDLPRTALEAMALEFYRSERLSSFQTMEMLGFGNRLELDRFLKARGIELEYNFEDLKCEQVGLDLLLKK